MLRSRRIKELSCNDPAFAVKLAALHFQQGSFHCAAALITAEGAVRTNGSMTWNDERERVIGQGCADSSGSRWSANNASD